MAKMNINWPWNTPKKTNIKKINIERLKDIETGTKYKHNVENRLKDKVYENEQDRWKEMTKACTEASAEVLGYEEKKKTTRVTTHQEVIVLSNEQQILRENINTATSQEQKETLRIKRNKNMRELVKKIQEIENQKLLEEIEETENCKDESNRMYKAIRKSKDAIVVETEYGITTNEKESMKIVTDWFETAFKAENQTEFPDVLPKEKNHSEEMK